jgi:hypothetical protein
MKLFLTFVFMIVSLQCLASDEINQQLNCDDEYKKVCGADRDIPNNFICNEVMMEQLSHQCKQQLDSNARLKAFSSFGRFHENSDAQRRNALTEAID